MLKFSDIRKWEESEAKRDPTHALNPPYLGPLPEPVDDSIRPAARSSSSLVSKKLVAGNRGDEKSVGEDEPNRGTIVEDFPRIVKYEKSTRFYSGTKRLFHIRAYVEKQKPWLERYLKWLRTTGISGKSRVIAISSSSAPADSASPPIAPLVPSVLSPADEKYSQPSGEQTAHDPIQSPSIHLGVRPQRGQQNVQFQSRDKEGRWFRSNVTTRRSEPAVETWKRIMQSALNKYEYLIDNKAPNPSWNEHVVFLFAIEQFFVLGLDKPDLTNALVPQTVAKLMAPLLISATVHRPERVNAFREIMEWMNTVEQCQSLAQVEEKGHLDVPFFGQIRLPVRFFAHKKVALAYAGKKEKCMFSITIGTRDIRVIDISDVRTVRAFAGLQSQSESDAVKRTTEQVDRKTDGDGGDTTAYPFVSWRPYEQQTMLFLTEQGDINEHRISMITKIFQPRYNEFVKEYDRQISLIKTRAKEWAVKYGWRGNAVLSVSPKPDVSSASAEELNQWRTMANAAWIQFMRTSIETEMKFYDTVLLQTEHAPDINKDDIRTCWTFLKHKLRISDTSQMSSQQVLRAVQAAAEKKWPTYEEDREYFFEYVEGECNGYIVDPFRKAIRKELTNRFYAIGFGIFQQLGRYFVERKTADGKDHPSKTKLLTLDKYSRPTADTHLTHLHQYWNELFERELISPYGLWIALQWNVIHNEGDQQRISFFGYDALILHTFVHSPWIKAHAIDGWVCQDPFEVMIMFPERFAPGLEAQKAHPMTLDDIQANPFQIYLSEWYDDD
jgi:hypothetical protein